MKKFQIKLFLVYTFLYTIIFSAVQLITYEDGQSLTKTLLIVLSTSLFFGIGMTLFEFRRYRTVAFQAQDFEAIIQRIKQLGFENDKRTKNGILWMTKKAKVRLAAEEYFFVNQTDDVIEVDGLKHHLKILEKHFTSLNIS